MGESLSPTIGGCSASEAGAEGGLAPLAEVRSQLPITIKNKVDGALERVKR